MTKRMVRQQGLLQLAYMDAVRYRCDFNWQHDRTLPEKRPSPNHPATREQPALRRKDYGEPDAQAEEASAFVHQLLGNAAARDYQL